MTNPYPNEWAVRINTSDKYDRIRRYNNKFGKGIHALWGIINKKPVELQAVRFDKDKFKKTDVRSFINKHGGKGVGLIIE